MNTVPCSQCVHCDVRHKYVNGQLQPIRGSAFCVAQSVYPHKEQDEQVFPPHARRAPPGQLAQMHVIDPKGLVRACTHAVAKPA